MDKPARILAVISLCLSLITVVLAIFITSTMNHIAGIAEDTKAAVNTAVEKAHDAKECVAEWAGTRDAEEMRLKAKEALIDARDDALRKKEEYIAACEEGSDAVLRWLKGAPQETILDETIRGSEN